MGLITKQGKSIDNPFDKDNKLTTAYVHCKYNGGINEKNQEDVQFDLFGYANANLKNSTPILQQNIVIDFEDYKNIINKEITTQELEEGDTPDKIKIRRFYNYIMTLTEVRKIRGVDGNIQEETFPIMLFGIPITDWKSDENANTNT